MVFMICALFFVVTLHGYLGYIVQRRLWLYLVLFGGRWLTIRLLYGVREHLLYIHIIRDLIWLRSASLQFVVMGWALRRVLLPWS